ncbi:MAG TPA: RsmD family RNA methyltransferase [Patescibacteria group bacterium]|nr:RsmD family RNA methyltransferase [Patescibacteria group bacterium]
MRVIAGRLGGRVFDSPGTNRTHPMSDKARGALFNILGDIEGLRVLDAFAGSGALSFEAASRGAGHVVAIESDKPAQQAIVRNIETLGLGKDVRLVTATANAWLNTAAPTTFDIVLCDPPYDDLQQPLLTKLAERVGEGGLFVLSWPGNTEPPAFDGFEQASQRSYGDMQLVFYRKI